MLFTTIKLVLGGAFLLGMVFLCFGQFVITFGKETWLAYRLRNILGHRFYNLLMSFYPKALIIPTRIATLLLGLMMLVLFIYFLLSVFAVYMNFNPFNITPGFRGAQIK